MSKSKILSVVLALMPIAAHAADAEIMAELSRRGQIPMMEILPALDHCDRVQHTRNLCAFYDAVEAEMAFDRLAEGTDYPADGDYAAFKTALSEACVANARARTDDARQVPEFISLCLADAFDSRRGQVIAGGNLFPLHAFNPTTRGRAAIVGDMDDDD